MFVVFFVVISRGACIVYKDRKALKFERSRLLSGKSSRTHRKISVIRAENYTSETGSVGTHFKYTGIWTEFADL
jgi:hypothetical protein